MYMSRIHRFLLVLTLVLSSPAMAQEGAGKRPTFVSMNPHFTVNLGDGSFLQLEAQTLVRNTETYDALMANMSPVRHNLIMYFSDLFPEDMSSANQREELRTAAARIIKETLTNMSQPDDVRGFFITSLIMQ